MKRFSKRSLVVASAITAVVTVGGVAFAYWTTTGAGAGSASTTTNIGTDKILLTQVGAVTGFYPGSTAQNVVVKAHNPAAYSQKVGEVTVVVEDATGCPATNWTVTNVVDSFGILAAGADSDPAGQTVATIFLKDTTSNQDGCKSVNPTLTFSSAAGAL